MPPHQTGNCSAIAHTGVIWLARMEPEVFMIGYNKSPEPKEAIETSYDIKANH